MVEKMRGEPASGTISTIRITPAMAKPSGFTIASISARVRALVAAGNGTYSACMVVSWMVNWKPRSLNLSTAATAMRGHASRAPLDSPKARGMTAMPAPTPRRASRRGVTRIWKRNAMLPLTA